MSVYIDRKYLLFLSSRLKNFKQKKTDLFNFSCPICGDSQKNRLKARGYVYVIDNHYLYTCHNGCPTIPFARLLMHIDPSMYKQYMMEKFSNSYQKVRRSEKTDEITLPQDPKLKIMSNFKPIHEGLSSIEDLPDEHYAKVYIRGRCIPDDRLKDIHYTDDFKKFMDDNYSGHGKDLIQDDPRIVMFYKDLNGYITHVAGRSLRVEEGKLRYMTVKVSTIDRKIFGADLVDFNKPVYVLEGQFDSMFIPNSVASGDSNLAGLAEYLRKECGAETILIFDNQPRNKQIVKLIREAVKENFTVTIFPDTLEGKDVNAMVKDHGKTKEEILSMIKSHTYSGLTANLEFTKWRKC